MPEIVANLLNVDVFYLDVKLQLGPAYGETLSSLPPNPSTSSLANKTTEKLVADFRYLQGQSTGSLTKFMEYLTYSYMIDNVALLITGTLHERDTKELLERCHPLGWFETMPVLCVATNVEELYNSVLIETPLAPYFKGSLSHHDLDELNIEIVRNTLYKNYLEDFYRFCNNDPEMSMTSTGEIMSEILEFEADRRAINITINSFGTELSKDQRKKLYPEFGKLHPEGMLMLSRADDIESVGLAVSGVGDYKRFFDEVGLNQGGGGIGAGNMSGGTGGDQKSLEDIFYQKEMELSKMVFTRQFTHAVIYAWVKLREQVRQSRRGPSFWVQQLTPISGDPEHHLDRRVYSAKPEGQNRELHLCVLNGVHIVSQSGLEPATVHTSVMDQALASHMGVSCLVLDSGGSVPLSQHRCVASTTSSPSFPNVLMHDPGWKSLSSCCTHPSQWYSFPCSLSEERLDC